MAEGLPPLILELRAHAGEMYAELGKAKKEIASLNKESEGGATATQKMGKVGGAAFAGLALGAIALGGESIKMAVDFQKSTTLLVTAGGESQGNLKMVSDGILQVSNDTGISAEKMSEGMYIVEKSGHRGAEGLTVLKAAAEGATAEGVGVDVMATALTSVMASFNVPTKDAAKAMSALDRGAGLAKTTMTDFASSLSSVTPAANAAHMNLPGLLANIATLTQHGTSAAEATQELSHTIMKLSGTPTLQMQNAMNGLGIKSQDLRDAMAGPQGLTGAIEIVQNAIRAHMGPAGQVVIDTFKQSAQATANLGVEMGHMSGELLDNSKAFLAGKMTLAQYMHEAGGMSVQQLRMAQGFAATAKQAQGFNTLLTKGNQVTRSAGAALRDVMGDSVSYKTALMLTGDASDKNSNSLAYNTKALKDISDQYNKGGEHIATYAETQATVAVQAAKLRAGVENVAITMGTFLLPMVMNVVKWLQTVVQWVAHNWQWLGKLVIGILAVGGAYKVLSAIMSLSPFGAILLGVSLLVAGFIVLWNKSAAFRDFFIGIWNSIKGPVLTAWAVIKDAAQHTVEWFVNTAWPAIQRFGAWLVQLFQQAWPTIKTAFGMIVLGAKTAVDWFITYAWPVIQQFVGFMVKAFQQAWPYIKAAFGMYIDIIKTVIGWFFSTALPAIGRFIGYVIVGFQTAWPYIKAAFGIIVDVIKVAWAIIKVIFDVIVTTIKVLVAAFQWAWPGIKLVFNLIVGVIQVTWAIIKTVFDLIVGAVELLVAGFQVASPAIKAVWDYVVGAIKVAWTILSAVFDAVVVGVEALVTAFQVTFAAIKAVAVAVWTAISTFITGVWTTISTAASTIWTAIKTVIVAVWTAISAVAKTVWTAISALITGIWTALSADATAIWHAIKAVITGVWDAIKVAASIVWGLISGVITGVWDAIKGAAKIVWGAISGVITGVWDGIKTAASTVWTAITGVFTSAWDKISGLAKTAWAAISGVITPIWDALKVAAQKVWDGITGVFKAAWAVIQGAASTAWDAITVAIIQPLHSASDIIGTIVDGITGFFSRAWSTIQSIVSQIRAAASDALNLINPLSSGAGGTFNTHPGTNPPHALGGVLASGWTMVGDDGPEMVNTVGGQSTVYSNPHTVGGNKIPGGSSGGGGGSTSHSSTTNSVTVQVSTNASPALIASELGWTLRNLA